MSLTLVPEFETEEDATAWLFARPSSRTPHAAVARLAAGETTATELEREAGPPRVEPRHPVAPPNVSRFANAGAIDAVIEDLDTRFGVLGSGSSRKDVFYALRSFIGYAHDRQGFDLDAETMSAVLTSYGAIWNYVHIDRVDLRPSAKRSVHNRLVAAARRVLRAQGRGSEAGAFVPEAGSDTARVTPQSPYSDDEVARIVEWATSRGTARSRADATAIVALGLGAGLTREEMVKVTYDDLTVRRGVVFVRVRESRYVDYERVIPMTEPWGTMLVEAVIPFGRGDEPIVLPGYASRNGKSVASFIADSKRLLGGGLDPVPTRLRATWIAAHARNKVPPRSLYRISGIGYRTSMKRAIVGAGVMGQKEFQAWQKGVSGPKDKWGKDWGKGDETPSRVYLPN